MPLWAIKLIALAGLALVLVSMKHHYDESRRDEGRAEVQAKWDADKAARLKAYADMTTKWVIASGDAEKAIKERDDARAQLFQKQKAKAAALPEHIAALPVPYQSVVVLNDAIRDSAAPTGAAAESGQAAPSTPPGADSTVGLLTQWGVDMIAWADECRARVQSWSSFYSDLRSKQKGMTQ